MNVWAVDGVVAVGTAAVDLDLRVEQQVFLRWPHHRALPHAVWFADVGW